MSFLTGLLTVVMVLDSVLLILLVLIQLPKKETGAGIAFGGSAADALFGAGSGNVLTKTTKYATVIFFVLLLFLGYLQSKNYHKSAADFQRNVEQQNRSGGLPVMPPPAESRATVPAATNLLTTSALTATNPPVAPSPVSPPPPAPQQK